MKDTYFDDWIRQEKNPYERVVQVKPYDMVLDLGCSKGYFYYVHTLEPITYVGVDASIDCLEDFKKALDVGEKPLLLNSFIGETVCEVSHKSMFHPQAPAQTTLCLPFSGLLRLLTFPVIDFLKLDIEGFEVAIWESISEYTFFKKYVRKFSGEIHFVTRTISRERMMNCLLRLKHDSDLEIKLHSVDGVDITEYFWSNPNYYSEIILSGTNRSLVI